MTYTVDLFGQALIEAIIRDIRDGVKTPVIAIEHALEEHLLESFSRSLSNVITKPPVVRIHNFYFKDRFATFPALCNSGYKTWYIEVVFTTNLPTSVTGIEFRTKGIVLESISYGGGINIKTQLKSKQMKTQVRHDLRINTLSIGKEIFVEILDILRNEVDLRQPFIANFSCGPDIEMFRTVSFDHVLTGERYHCSCAEPYHGGLNAEAKHIRSGYVEGSWPHQMTSMLSKPKYLEGICHLCIARSSSADLARQRYGPSIEDHFESYVDQLIVDMQIDRKTARAEAQQLLGLSRWIREAELYRTVRELFPNHRVLREASPLWLERLRFDIYLPELKLAIEHQGEQHFRPLSVFGGEEAHQKTIERDLIKKQRCAENGVHLVEVRYDAPITKAALKNRLKRFIDGG